MQGREHVNNVLKALSIRDGIPKLSLDLFDCVGIQLKDQTFFQIEYNRSVESVITYFAIGNTEQFSLKKADLYESLLVQNNSPFSRKFILNERADQIYLVDVTETSNFSISYIDDLIAESLDVIKKTLDKLIAQAESSKRSSAANHSATSLLQSRSSASRLRSNLIESQNHA